MTSVQYLLAIFSGCLVGFALGLIGGGGSILAVPLLVYLVGLSDPHLAIGTSAIAVAVSAALNLAQHSRSGSVRWRAGLIHASAGIAGAVIGSALGKQMEGKQLLILFSLLMLTVGGWMLRRSSASRAPVAERESAGPRLAVFGFGTGTVAGFFGVGGGFLIVPALTASTNMPILNAVATSLVAVTAFGLTTALSYAGSGMVDWCVAIAFVVGGGAGGLAGGNAARWLAKSGALAPIFASIILATGGWMLCRTLLDS